MKEIILRTPTVTEDAEESALARDQKRLNHWKSMLVICIAAGVIAAASGLILGAISYLVFFKHPDIVNQIGNLLIIAAFPLMMLGAHALDKISEIKKRKNKFEP